MIDDELEVPLCLPDPETCSSDGGSRCSAPALGSVPWGRHHPLVPALFNTKAQPSPPMEPTSCLMPRRTSPCMGGPAMRRHAHAWLPPGSITRSDAGITLVGLLLSSILLLTCHGHLIQFFREGRNVREMPQPKDRHLNMPTLSQITTASCELGVVLCPCAPAPQ